ncbi:maleylpyruvate isomerase family mycothiol-dependent enzyme [Catenulispora pinisilvae]|uniref:maleylpyruvate isomerase family mycothiol-dependent enzyme n=1 Tax=Catenulispora pinisilvae TaxID=2705253 RepID=UPI0018927D37|nr:maleylpyruvate isomerase family mycothiol-dependent enzyme [Catenulispora pinisilvae]
MDHIAHFERETTAFHRAALMAAMPAAPPPVPSCPDWTTADLVRHISRVHRLVNHVIVDRLQSPPPDRQKLFTAPADATGEDLADWFAEGAIALAATFHSTAPEVPVWTWGTQHDVGFWLRVQTIEVAVHRWDLEGAIGSPQPVDEELAADGVAQFLDVVVPFRRGSLKDLPPMGGESYRFRQTDGREVWSIVLDPDGPRPLGEDEPADVELAGSASDLLLFLWHRIPGEPLMTKGDAKTLERFFVMVPTV